MKPITSLALPREKINENSLNEDFDFFKEYNTLKIEAPISIHFEYDLGGAETGKKTTTMDHEKIFGMMKTDLDWIRTRMKKNQIEA